MGIKTKNVFPLNFHKKACCQQKQKCLYYNQNMLNVYLNKNHNHRRIQEFFRGAHFRKFPKNCYILSLMLKIKNAGVATPRAPPPCIRLCTIYNCIEMKIIDSYECNVLTTKK